jgi:hypothetical protein
MISQRAVDLIVSCEVSSRKQYEKLYHRPEWPGGNSGVTIGIGYDLGMASAGKIEADWRGRVNDEMLAVMVSCAGVHGNAARPLCASVRDKIDIPWDIAIDVFLNRDIPEWEGAVSRAVPDSKVLSADCRGALVSLAYNRGAGGFNSTSDRFSEMRAIKQHISEKLYSKVPVDFKGMKRLWPDMKGLRDRRDAEAELFQRGLVLSEKSSPPVVRDNPPPVLPPKPASNAEKGATGGTVVTTTTAAVQSGLPEWAIALIIFGGVCVAVALFFYMKSKRSPQVARVKDFNSGGSHEGI